VIGRTLNQCKILGKLGSGGMGEVYLAEDTRLNRQVALKLLPAEMAGDPDRRMRFEREAQAIAALNHPNIVTIYSVEEAEGLNFLTMELVEGRSLGELIESEGLPLRKLLELSISLTDAVSAAHESGITHRDLKPENVMVNEQDRLKVLDFGLAKLKDPFLGEGAGEADATQIPTTAETREGTILGTVAYMSPEQAQGQAIDPRSDVFSLGILLYEMATGQRPFKGDNNISVLSAILKDSPRPVGELKADLPPLLQEILDRALQKRPDRRFASATEMRDALQELKSEVDTGELLSSSGVSGPLQRRAGAGRRWGPIVAIAVLGLAVLALGLLAFRPGGLSSGGESAGVAVADEGRPSLAVFYFENLTGDPELDWLRTGLTDMLVTDLSQSPNLRVLDTARLYQILDKADRLDERQTSVESVREVARRADVGSALVGSYVKAGSTIRINARLQDATSGEILSSEQVEGEGESSIFGLVDELSRRIQGRFDLPAVADNDLDRDLEDVSTDSLEAYKFYAEGIRLHEQFKEEEALPLLEKAAEIDPDFGMALAKLSVVHGNLGHMDEARTFAKRAVDLVDHLSTRERYYIEGRHYSLYPDTQRESIAAYEKAVELFPDHASARNNLAQKYASLNRYGEALEHLEELRRRRMSFPGTWSFLAKMYGMVGQPEKGLEALEEYVRENPANAAGHRNLAGHLTASGRYDEALEALQEAASIDPANFELGEQVCNLHLLRGDWSAVESKAEELRERSDPFQRMRAEGCDALRLMYLGRTREAHARQQELIASLPESPGFRRQMLEYEVRTLYTLGEYDETLEVAGTLIDLGNEVPDAAISGHVLSALVQTRRGDVAAAERHLEQIEGFMQALPEEQQQVLHALFEGLFAGARADWPAAIAGLSHAEEALGPGFGAVSTDYSLVRSELARACEAAGRPDDAIAALRRITDSGVQRLITPLEYVRSLYHLGRLYEERGEVEAAQDHFRRFLEHWDQGDVDRDLVEDARRRVATPSV
jgi:tetratricopeptide (TPR) repeat protein/predicted Ser/Thr protein kinase